MVYKETALLISLLDIAYFEFLSYKILNSVSDCRRFFKNFCYSQQIIPALAKESLIHYNHRQKAPETQKR